MIRIYHYRLSCRVINVRLPLSFRNIPRRVVVVAIVEISKLGFVDMTVEEDARGTAKVGERHSPE